MKVRLSVSDIRAVVAVVGGEYYCTPHTVLSAD